MNQPNMPYGQMPYGGQPPQRLPPHMRHMGYYMPPPPHMGPMYPPPPYGQNYYPYHMPQQMPHGPRGGQYYPPQGPPIHHHPHYTSTPPIPPPAMGRPQSPRTMSQGAPPVTHLSSNLSATASSSARASPSPQSSAKESDARSPDDKTSPALPLETPAPSHSVESASLDTPFYPPVPWLSVRDQPFPQRAASRKRRIPRSKIATEPVEFPLLAQTTPQALPSPPESTEKERNFDSQRSELSDSVETDPPSAPTPVQTPTPLTSDAPSEGSSTQPTTPSSALLTPSFNTQHTPTQTKASRHMAPVLPAIPIIPNSPSAARKPSRDAPSAPTMKELEAAPVTTDATPQTVAESEPVEIAPAPSPQPPPPPKSWADLVRSKNSAPLSQPVIAGSQLPSGLLAPKTGALSDVLSQLNLESTQGSSKITLLQPRGLVNTGNMCYMNSVLQMAVFCIPFYDFLDKVSKKATHVFKSDTPIIDALIMFMREYPVIDSAPSVEQLKLRLKPEDFEKYGDPFIPEYVYQIVRDLPRFRDMRRGHQQDAQEFLGFLLEELHEECAHAIRTGNSGRTTPIAVSEPSDSAENDSGWMEVGHKQKPAVTRSSGATLTESPITHIFGGKLRSELKIPGNKMSITLEPYQPLQLDIGSPQITNIVEALKGLTRPESMQGDFQSSRGMKATATKQVFIETLPPVLILHLKRFHYDSETKRTEKIWKKVGYPLELEIPKEVFTSQVRNKLAAHGSLPKYRLIGVIYHHGKHASGGHYTVDIRRQDGQEWIRVDDTLIRRVRSEDVAEGGAEEDPKILAAALEKHNQQKSGPNRFEQIEGEEVSLDSERAWSQVNGHTRNKSTLGSIVNGNITPAKESTSGMQTPSAKYSVKDNKVAYLLFYQRISA